MKRGRKNKKRKKFHRWVVSKLFHRRDSICVIGGKKPIRSTLLQIQSSDDGQLCEMDGSFLFESQRLLGSQVNSDNVALIGRSYWGNQGRLRVGGGGGGGCRCLMINL